MAQPLYRGMDRDEIDYQLNLRGRWPEHTESIALWQRESAAVRGRLAGHLDLSYGPSAGQTLDIFPASGPGPGPGSGPGRGAAPLLAFIHGGYWQGLDKDDFSYLAPPFVESGIAFASLNYDLAPAVTIGEIVGQIRRAFAWLAAKGADYGIDPARIYVVGHSAGGHLAAMMMASDLIPADLIKGGCCVSGVYELEPLRLSYQQEVLRIDEETVRTMSPLRCLPAQAGPLICAVGSIETDEFLRQQDEFVNAWRAGGLEARVVDLPERQHFTAIDALSEPEHPLFAAVKDLILGGK